MSDQEIRWSQKTQNEGSCGPHKDYQANLNQSRMFMNKVQNNLISGISVTIGGAGGQGGNIPDCLLNISWKPSEDQTMISSRFCTPIFMHQPKEEFRKQIETVFNSYVTMAKQSQPRMIQGNLLASKA